MSRFTPLGDNKAFATEKVASDRSVGVVFAVVFAIVGAWAIYRDVLWLALPALFLSVLLAAIAWKAPSRLSKLNRAWTAFGHLLHRIISPLTLGGLYFLVFTPTGWVARRFGYDPLRMRPAAETSYWVSRPAGEPDPKSMRNQF